MAHGRHRFVVYPSNQLTPDALTVQTQQIVGCKQLGMGTNVWFPLSQRVTNMLLQPTDCIHYRCMHQRLTPSRLVLDERW